MTLQLTTRRLVIGGAVALVCALYLADLTGMGLVSKDEPLYADIGRAMARTGDWVTPRLWGQPWFQKPALLYWMIAAGFTARLGPDLAPRLPVALMSLAFLTFFWWRVRYVWDERVASYATIILATSAGWLAYSHVAVTDLPLAALFTVALLFALHPERASDRVYAASALALAALAKGLVPLVLFVPVLALDYRRLREWFRPAPVIAFTAICFPWYILCAIRNGAEFPRVLLLEHTFGRFYSTALQHQQGMFFYFPVLLLLLYPWFPLLMAVPRELHDRRVVTLLAVTVFGFVFFSAAVNKLPGYLLPLIPAFCLLIGIGISRSRLTEWILVLPVALLGALPVAVQTLPQALAHSLRTSPVDWVRLVWWMAGSSAAGLVLVMVLRKKAFAVTAALIAASFLWFQMAAFPALDRSASAREIWRQYHPDCLKNADRGLVYGLQYYAGRSLPPCTVLDQTAIRSVR